MGVSAVYLEKPGAPTVSLLEGMRAQSEASGIPVVMGYNKGVSKYVSQVLSFLSASGRSDLRVTFGSNNDYDPSPASLGECFERNSEGMLKNMAIHELALLVTYFGVTADNIEKVHACKKFSKVLTLKGPSGSSFTDFQRVKFTVTTNGGQKATVVADRCGGTDSFATVEGPGSVELFRSGQPGKGKEDGESLERLRGKYPGAMAYFLAQDEDYVTLKEAAAGVARGDKTRPKGVVGIKEAIDTLKVAEFLTPLLIKQLTE
jgi:predicted dehydrogenase